MKKFGIDISKWQGDFDFDRAVAEGVEFVIIKGGGADDGLYKDRMFERNYDEAKKRGLPVGCYWFSKALTTQEAVKEADWFYANVLDGKQFELPIYMDVEHKTMMSLGKDKLTEIVKYFCERLEAKGCFVGVYSSKSYFDAKMHDGKIQEYAHWVAQWSKNCTYKGEENVLGMWQFGGEMNAIRTNKVAGVVCDQNYMFLDYPSLIKGAGLNGFKKAVTDTSAKEEPFLVTVGAEVKLSKDAMIYGTNKRFAEWVYDAKLYVREINSRRIVVSTLKEGDVTGAVDIMHIKRLDTSHS